MLRSILAPNASPMTLTGTRTYIVGRARVVVIDPGSGAESHLDAIVDAVGDASVECIALTHLHPDHVSGSEPLAERLGTVVRGIGLDTLEEGHRMKTDAGDLVAMHAPGHTPDHALFHWPGARAVFCGDLMMGGLETALVAPPEGRLRDYFASLEIIRTLDPRVIHPAHGDSFDEPWRALDAYVRHREERLARVLEAIAGGARDAGALVDRVYGDTVPAGLRPVALDAVLAYVEFLEEEGEVRRGSDGWKTAASGRERESQ